MTKQGKFRYLLTWLLFFGIYIGNSLPQSGSIRVPAAIAGLAGIFLLLINLKNVRLQHVNWMLAIATLCLVSLTLRAYTSPAMSSHAIDHLMSWIVLVYSITIGYAAYLELTQWSRHRIELMFKILIWMLLVGAALEVFVPTFKDLSDAFRTTVFESGLYEADFRDAAYYGGIRPKLFTSEPSHLAKYFVLFTLAWLFITDQKQKYLWFFSYVMVGLFLIRSPIALIAPVVGLVHLFISQERITTAQKVVLLLCLCILIVPGMFLFAKMALIPRFDLAMSGQDASFILRLLAPFQVMLVVISDYPVLGLGFGAKEVGFKYMSEAVASLIHSSRQEVHFIGLGHNFILLSLMQFGVAGFVVFVFLLWRMLAIFAQRELFLVTITIVGFMNSTGSPNSFRIWVFLFVLCAIMYVRSRSTREEGFGAPQPTQKSPVLDSTCSC